MTYQVGVIGTGFGSKVQIPAMQSNGNFNVVSLAGTKADKTREIAESLNIDHWTTNWKDLLTKSLDLIVVSTPPYLHYQMAQAVLNSDINLLLEKPTTSNAFEAKELYRLSEDKGLVGMLSHEFRWVPERHYLRDLLLQGEIGKIREIYLTQFMNFGAAAKVAQFGWFWNSLYEGGIIGALGSHLIDYVRYFAGDEFRTVQGGLQRIVKEKTDAKGVVHRVSADTGFNFNFEMEKGIFGNFTASSTIHHPPGARLTIGGEEGTIIVEDGISIAKIGEELQKIEIPEKYNLDMELAEKDGRIPPYLKLLEELEKSLQSGRSLSPNLYDGWKNQQVLDAVKLSDRSGNRVTIVD